MTVKTTKMSDTMKRNEENCTEADETTRELPELVVYTIVKGNSENEGNLIKNNAIETLCRYAEKLGWTAILYNTGSTIIVLPAGIPGDYGEIRRLFRNVDLIGPLGQEECRKRGERMYETYAGMVADGEISAHALGTESLKIILDEMYMRYDVAEITKSELLTLYKLRSVAKKSATHTR